MASTSTTPPVSQPTQEEIDLAAQNAADNHAMTMATTKNMMANSQDQFMKTMTEMQTSTTKIMSRAMEKVVSPN